MPRVAFPRNTSLLIADDPDETCTNEQETCHEEQRRFGAVVHGDPATQKAAETAADDSSTAEHAEEALGFPRGPDKVRQSPYLRHCQNAENTDPEIEQWRQPRPLMNLQAPPDCDKV